MGPNVSPNVWELVEIDTSGTAKAAKNLIFLEFDVGGGSAHSQNWDGGSDAWELFQNSPIFFFLSNSLKTAKKNSDVHDTIFIYAAATLFD